MAHDTVLERQELLDACRAPAWNPTSFIPKRLLAGVGCRKGSLLVRPLGPDEAPKGGHKALPARPFPQLGYARAGECGLHLVLDILRMACAWVGSGEGQPRVLSGSRRPQKSKETRGDGPTSRLSGDTVASACAFIASILYQC